MGVGDYFCVTLSGGAPWGFRLQGGKDLKQPVQISRVRKKSKACRAGLREGDEVVAINGEPCCDFTHSEVISIIDDVKDNLQLLIKRLSNDVDETVKPEPEEEAVGVEVSDELQSADHLESTTLEIRPPVKQVETELFISESQDEAYYAEIEINTDAVGVHHQKPSSLFGSLSPEKRVSPQQQFQEEASFESFTEGIRKGDTVELQVSLSHDKAVSPEASASLVLEAERNSSFREEPGFQCNEVVQEQTPDTSLCSRAEAVQQSTKVIQISNSKQSFIIHSINNEDTSLPKVEVILDFSNKQKETSRADTESGCDKSLEEGGQTEAAPPTASFGVSSECTEQGEDEQLLEKDHIRPHRHRARHSRLRRSQSLSEKQVKEAKTKCKSIALLLTQANNPNSKGVLMFKKRRQRAKKYTLVSYGTGELEPEEEDGDEENTFEVTLLGTSDSELDEDFFSNGENDTQVVTFDWDLGFMKVENKTKSEDDMQTLQETKGKGALLFAKRRQRIEQLAAEQEETRRCVVERDEPREADTAESMKVQSSFQVANSYSSESAIRSHAYIDVGQQQGYVSGIQNGIAGNSETIADCTFQSTDSQKSTVLNRMARPFFGVQNQTAAPFSPTQNVTIPHSDLPAPHVYSPVKPSVDAVYRVASPPNQSQPAVWSPGGVVEQIASRDERISVPAKRTGILQDAKRRSTKPMFTFKEPPKVAPNPDLLSLVQNKEIKRGQPGAGGFESGPEEDYLSLGAEACNFMQKPAAKQKTPPPVAPKPSVKTSPTGMSPQSPPWSPSADLPVQTPTFSSKLTSQEPVPGKVYSGQTANSWQPPSSAPHQASVITGPQALSSGQAYIYKTPPTAPVLNTAPAGGIGPAYEMPALKGKGAELFAKRQSRMEKFVVDSSTVQSNKPRSPSPTASLPPSWKYSPNVRAPPPVSYNPIHSPFYPLAATKQHAKSSPSGTKAKGAKGKGPSKALHALDVMKYQPYQLSSSLFTYQPISDTDVPSPKGAHLPKQPVKSDPVPPVKPAQPSRQVNTSHPGMFEGQSLPTGPAYRQSSVAPPVRDALYPSYIDATSDESYVVQSQPPFSQQEPVISSLITTPKPKFSARKAGVSAQVQQNVNYSTPSQTMCVYQTLPFTPSATFQPLRRETETSTLLPHKSTKPLTPWEAASRSPLGLVDEAFEARNIQETIAANVVSAARRKTLPEPPNEWTERVSYTPPTGTGFSTQSLLMARQQPSLMSPAKSTVSAPGSVQQSGLYAKWPLYSHRAMTEPDMVSLGSGSDHSSSKPDRNYNPYPRGWRRQT